MTTTIFLSDLRCAECGAVGVHLVAPGHEGERSDVVGRVTRGEPIKAWCSMECALPHALSQGVRT